MMFRMQHQAKKEFCYLGYKIFHQITIRCSFQIFLCQDLKSYIFEHYRPVNIFRLFISLSLYFPLYSFFSSHFVFLNRNFLLNIIILQMIFTCFIRNTYHKNCRLLFLYNVCIQVRDLHLSSTAFYYKYGNRDIAYQNCHYSNPIYLYSFFNTVYQY